VQRSPLRSLMLSIEAEGDDMRLGGVKGLIERTLSRRFTCRFPSKPSVLPVLAAVVVRYRMGASSGVLE
jgi:hypothetical protein